MRMRFVRYIFEDKMASTAKSLEDMLSSDVDESAVSALVGSLESQLASPIAHGHVGDTGSGNLVNSNHINSALISNDSASSSLTTSQKLSTSANISHVNQSSSVGNNCATSTNIIANSISNATFQSSTSSDSRIGVPVSVVTTVMNSGGLLSQTTSSPVHTQAKSAPPINNNSNSNVSNTSFASLNQQSTFVTTSAQVISNGNVLPVERIVNQQNAPELNTNANNLTMPNISSTSATQGNSLNSSPIVNSSPVLQSVSDNRSNDHTLLKNATIIQTSAPSNVLKPGAVQTSASPVIGASKPGVISQVATTQGNVLQGVQILNMNPNSVRTGNTSVTIAVSQPNSCATQVVSAVTQPKTLAPRVVIGNPLRIAAGQQMITTRPSGPNSVPNTITLQPGMVRGTLLVKTENGHYQLVNVAPALAPTSNAGNIPVSTAYRLQQTQSSLSHIRNPTPQQLTVTLPVNATNGQVKPQQATASSTVMSQTYSSQKGSIPVSMPQVRMHGNINPSMTARIPPSSMSARHPPPFHNIASPMHTRHPYDRPHHPSMCAERNVINRQTIGSVSSTIGQPLSVQTTMPSQSSGPVSSSQMSPDTAKKKCTNFLSTLIRLAGDQPEQVAKNVKNLIQGLIDGIVNPEDFTVQLQKELHSSPQPCLVPFLKKSLPYLRHSLARKELSIQGVRPPPPGTIITLPSVPHSIPTIQLAQTRSTLAKGQTQVKLMSSTVPTMTHHLNQSTAIKHVMQRTTASKAATKVVSNASTVVSGGVPTSKSKLASQAFGKEKAEKRTFSSLRDDDDINDVAAMGGVNLVEESAKILAVNSELIGAEIRSCKDENFLFTTPLFQRVKNIASKYGLDEPSSDVISLISHAAQERLKNLVEKLGVIAEHRVENVKTDPRYEITNNVKAQLKFLEELDKSERKRHEEEEREILLRAAKSRSKVEDPEQQKLKLKAKEMQRQELEEMRQREANMTALLAIGPRKKFKPDQSSSSSSQSGTSANSPGHSSRPVVRARVKRVNLKDLLFLLEQEKDTSKSSSLYKAFLK